MMAPGLLTAAGIGFAGLSIATHVTAAALVARRLDGDGPAHRLPLDRLRPSRRTNVPPAAPMPDAGPRITLLRPACGIDALDPITLGSSFGLTHPDHEVIFCVAHENDPAAGLLRRLIAAHPDAPARLMVGETHISANPKLNNLEKGLQAARGRFVVMADANLMLPPDYLETLEAEWHAAENRVPGVGLVTSPPAAVAPEGFWALVECAFLNGYQGSWQLAADQLGLGYAQGKTLMWRRDLLLAWGGLAVLGRDLAEDVGATKMVRRAGLAVRLTRAPFAQLVGRRSLKAIWTRQLRWARVRRAGFPALFYPEILTGALPPLATLAALAASGAIGWIWPLLAAALWYGVEGALARRAGWPAGPKALLAAVLRDLMIPALWAWSLTARGFEWRGTAMDAAEDGPRIARPAHPVAAE
ncbi:glycosyltransferase [Phaeovulum vinaykumarii]|nr:glycosyltransferase [Phaeovulum vinaykumarii]